MSGTPAYWEIGGISARGASHKRREAPNQDAVGWQPQADTARHFVAAVSDGHGAAAHFHSEIGARLAVESALTALENFLAGQLSEAESGALAPQVVSLWQKKVLAQAAAGQNGDGWVEAVEDTLLPYGATLVAVAVSERCAVALQIGDGDIYFGYPDGRLERPLPSDNGLVGEQTYSLCALDAATRFRTLTLHAGGGIALPDFVMLSTDGVSKSFADEKAFASVAGHYRRAMLQAGRDAVFKDLPEWLNTVSERGSGDDVTLCLAARRSA